MDINDKKSSLSLIGSGIIGGILCYVLFFAFLFGEIFYCEFTAINGSCNSPSFFAPVVEVPIEACGDFMFSLTTDQDAGIAVGFLCSIIGGPSIFVFFGFILGVFFALIKKVINKKNNNQNNERQ